MKGQTPKSDPATLDQLLAAISLTSNVSITLSAPPSPSTRSTASPSVPGHSVSSSPLPPVPCAACRARGCLPPPAPDPQPEIFQPLVTSASEDTAKGWYVVTVGKQVGIFSDWMTVSPLVLSVSGAVHKKFATRAEAEAVFTAALNSNNVRVVR